MLLPHIRHHLGDWDGWEVVGPCQKVRGHSPEMPHCSYGPEGGFTGKMSFPTSCEGTLGDHIVIYIYTAPCGVHFPLVLSHTAVKRLHILLCLKGVIFVDFSQIACTLLGGGMPTGCKTLF
ncbi:UNVERIFIED_CONTAM: hypothetical protein K2H54_013283 [Gekko kuhli]